MTRPLPPPAAYAPDATGTPALWPWALAPRLRDRCATRGCLGRTPKPAPGDAPAAIVLCPACRVAAGYDAPAPVAAPAEPVRPVRAPAPCPTVGCGDTAAGVTADTWPELAPFCRSCRSRATSVLHRGTVHRSRIVEWLTEGRHAPGFAGEAYLARLRAQAGAL